MTTKAEPHGPPIVTWSTEDAIHRATYGYDGKRAFFMTSQSGIVKPGGYDIDVVPKNKVHSWFPRAAMELKNRYAAKIRAQQARLPQ